MVEFLPIPFTSELLFDIQFSLSYWATRTILFRGNVKIKLQRCDGSSASWLLRVPAETNKGWVRGVCTFGWGWWRESREKSWEKTGATVASFPACSNNAFDQNGKWYYETWQKLKIKDSDFPASNFPFLLKNFSFSKLLAEITLSKKIGLLPRIRKTNFK